MRSFIRRPSSRWMTARRRDMTYSAPIFVRARFLNAGTGEIKEQIVFMGDFPMMTEKGTFIINGTERVVVSQLVRSPGVIFQPGERYRLRNLAKYQLVTGTIHPYRGEWIEFDVEQKPRKEITAGVRVARKRRLPLFTLLRALGYDEENHPGFLERFVEHFDFLAEQWEKQGSPGPHARRFPHRDLQAGAARRPRPPPRRPARNFENSFFSGRRYDLSPGGPAQAQSQARPRVRLPRADLGTGDRATRSRPVAAVALRDAGRGHLPAQPGQGRARLPARRPGPFRQPPHPQRRRADPEPRCASVCRAWNGRCGNA